LALVAVVLAVVLATQSMPWTATQLPAAATSSAPLIDESSSSLPPVPPPPHVPLPPFTVLGEYAHDAASFTQGFELTPEGKLYEGSGLYGKSMLRELRYPLTKESDATVLADESGAARSVLLPDATHFGEGITLWQNRVVQLTWKARVGYVRRVDADSGAFGAVERRFVFKTTRKEGWGLTHDDAQLIVSDGSSYLHWWTMNASVGRADAEVMTQTRRVQVYDMVPSRATPGKMLRRSVSKLNELEYVAHRHVGGGASAKGGWVLANVWYDDRIACIDAATGRVVKWWHLAQLVAQAKAIFSGADVLNGIAYDAKRDVVLVTGKLWPRVYELKLAWPPVPSAA